MIIVLVFSVTVCVCVCVCVCVQEENIDLEELEMFAKTFKRRRIELGKSVLWEIFAKHRMAGR